MLKMVRFGTILSNLGAKAAQMFQMVSYGTVLDNFRSHGRPVAPNGSFTEACFVIEFGSASSS